MSDPRLTDPGRDPPPLREEDIRAQRLSELNSSNMMWGWVAGAIAVALILIFVLGRAATNNTETTASSPPPASSTTKAPTAPPATTGQGGAR